MMSLLTKPLSGGRAAIATAPTKKSTVVAGSLLAKPPSFSMSTV
jgi:hypothetical protein